MNSIILEETAKPLISIKTTCNLGYSLVLVILDTVYKNYNT